MNLTLPLFASLLLTAALQVWASDYKYIRVGSDHDVTTKALPGYALMGGGEDLDEAFRFLCEKGTGGDFLILRAAGDDEYNPYVNSLCKMNSVATLIIPSRQAANDPRVADVIEHAEAIFIAGGDQARYINWWQHTPVEDALNAHIAVGKSLGGTSAGLAVMGEYIYSAQGDAPDDPDTLTDSHFAKRNRMGRSLVFLARIVQDAWFANPREIAVDEKSAVLVESDGDARVIGPGKGAYFMQIHAAPSICRTGTPLSLQDIAVYHAPRNSRFNLKTWKGAGGVSYSLSVEDGAVHSTQRNGSVY